MAGVRAIRPMVKGKRVFGLALPPGFPCGHLPFPVAEDARWRPFEGSGVFQTRQVLLLPASPEPERTLAIRVLGRLSAEVLLLVDRCYALRSRFRKGSLAVVADHVNLTGINPLTGPNDDRIGPRYPNMTRPYSPVWTERLEQAARAGGEGIQRAVYAGVDLPPTPAEGRFLAYIGADVCGARIVTDTIVAVHCGVPVAAVARIVRICSPEDPPDETEESETQTGDLRLSEIVGRVLTAG
jgi:purine-nucleoside phosphorylase